ncbi:aldo/keto reductase [Amycolatopsis roodepoortensis]|uniref:Aryl-alcohol dehydrogenase-like predicted oxidoreductase n=1 Tax=Amycolatopsis roodepoortensis TaxID=700274 RepID=A0ABR9L9Y1_9PSEU|nr:aldo/keto reductase [Amycolatopsis roodepoortensis]MBE1577503.1 aryl-alcohol dehydrogenase-like predicted oxidoreductase [Amycolatopsis roodepoortensis]
MTVDDVRRPGARGNEYAARAQSFTEANALTPAANLQLPYSLVERTIEAEHVPMGRHLGLGITAWSQLAGGFLTGKYRQTGETPSGVGRLTWTYRDWALLKPLEKVATELGVTMAQVAINWVTTQPGVAASSADRQGKSMAALDFELPPDLRALLDEASAVPPESVYRMFTPEYQNWVISPG